MQRDWGPHDCRRSGWYTQVEGCRIERSPFYWGLHYIGEVCVTEGYVGMMQPSQKDVPMACQSAELRVTHREAEEDEGGTVAPSRQRLPTTEEAELYGQAGAQAATTMRMPREMDRQALRLEHQCWDVQEVEDLCHAVLQQVRDDTEAHRAAGQKRKWRPPCRTWSLKTQTS